MLHRRLIDTLHRQYYRRQKSSLNLLTRHFDTSFDEFHLDIREFAVNDLSIFLYMFFICR